MSLITLLFVLIIVGLVLYLVETYIPMAPPFKIIIRVVVILFLCVWLLQLLGITGPTLNVR